MVELQIRFPSHTLLSQEEIDFILIGPEVTVKKWVKNADYVMTYSGDAK